MLDIYPWWLFQYLIRRCSENIYRKKDGRGVEGGKRGSRENTSRTDLCGLGDCWIKMGRMRRDSISDGAAGSWPSRVGS